MKSNITFLMLSFILFTSCRTTPSSHLNEDGTSEKPEWKPFFHLQFSVNPFYDPIFQEGKVPLKQNNGDIKVVGVRSAEIEIKQLQYCQGKCTDEKVPSVVLDQGMAPFSPNQIVLQRGETETTVDRLGFIDLQPDAIKSESNKTFKLYANTEHDQPNAVKNGVNFGIYLGEASWWHADGNWILSKNLYLPFIQEKDNDGKWQDFIYKTPGYEDDPIDFSSPKYRVVLRQKAVK